MSQDTLTGHKEEKRSEPRNMLDLSCSVEIDLGRPVPIYQFKLRDLSSNGACVLVKEGSSMLSNIEIGRTLKMKYSSAEAPKSIEFLKADIKHITKQDEGRYKGHYLVGLNIVDKQLFISEKSAEVSLSSNKDLFDLTEAKAKQGRAARRSGAERRQLSNTGYFPERRSGKDRRSGIERRSGLDRRSMIDRRSGRNI